MATRSLAAQVQLSGLILNGGDTDISQIPSSICAPLPGCTPLESSQPPPSWAPRFLDFFFFWLGCIIFILNSPGFSEFTFPPPLYSVLCRAKVGHDSFLNTPVFKHVLERPRFLTSVRSQRFRVIPQMSGPGDADRKEKCVVR